jgi:Kdo2-lipid IVA lauroyltransferase/acyltransferase
MRFRTEFYLTCILLAGLGILPKSLAVWSAKRLAAIWRALDGKHREKILRDIERTPLKSLSQAEKAELVRKVYEHYGIMLAEVAKFRKWDADQVRDCISFEEGGELAKAASKGGCILITAHFGNWELSGMSLPLHGIPVAALARPLKNSHLDGTLNKLRTRFGQKVLVKFNVMLEVVRTLRAGYNVGMLIDQDAERDCAFVPFLGENAGTLTVPAKLALRLKMPVFCVMSYRIEPFRHKFRVIGPIELPSGEDAIEATAAKFNEIIGSVILEHPEQWLWLHHRWKTADRRGLTKLSGGVPEKLP